MRYGVRPHRAQSFYNRMFIFLVCSSGSCPGYLRAFFFRLQLHPPSFVFHKIETPVFIRQRLYTVLLIARKVVPFDNYIPAFLALRTAALSQIDAHLFVDVGHQLFCLCPLFLWCRLRFLLRCKLMLRLARPLLSARSVVNLTCPQSLFLCFCFAQPHAI